MDYVITKLLVRDRGISKDSKGRLAYSEGKLRKYEELLVQTDYNIKRFKEFKQAVMEKREIDVSASIGCNYTGIVLNDKIIVNLSKDDFLNIQEYVETPKGRLRVTQYPDRWKCNVYRNIDEDLESITESIYDLDYNDFRTTIVYTNSMTFQCIGLGTISPKAIVEAPNYKVKDEYREYFEQISTRGKLMRRLKEEKSLRNIIKLYELIPQEFKDARTTWNFDRIVYDYVCENPKFLHEV